MKVLFLDIDGVLNKRSDGEVITETDSIYTVNRVLLEHLHKIVEDTNCKIVLSSTWRIFKDGIEFLEEYGQLEIFDVTKRIHNGRRGEEIQVYLDEHPDVESYAIVDDDSDMLDSQLRNFFQTDPLHGLTETIAYRITFRLNKGIKDDKYGSLLTA